MGRLLCHIHQKQISSLDIVTQTYNPGQWELEAGDLTVEVVLHHMRLRPSCANLTRSKFQIPAMHFMIVFHLSEYKKQVIVCETVLIPWFQVLDSVLFFLA